MMFHPAFAGGSPKFLWWLKKEVSSPAFHMCGCAFYSFIFLICAIDTNFIDLISLYWIINVRARRSLNVSHLFALLLQRLLQNYLMLREPLITGLTCLLYNSRICLCCFVANDILENFSLYFQETHPWLCQNSSLNEGEDASCVSWLCVIFGSCGEGTGKVGQQSLWPFFLQGGFLTTEVSWMLMGLRPSCLLIFPFPVLSSYLLKYLSLQVKQVCMINQAVQVMLGFQTVLDVT